MQQLQNSDRHTNIAAQHCRASRQANVQAVASSGAGQSSRAGRAECRIHLTSLSSIHSHIWLSASPGLEELPGKIVVKVAQGLSVLRV